jgi:hypothetical protein
MKSVKSRTLFIVVLILIAGLYVSDHLFLQRRDVASFSGRVVATESKKYFDLTDVPEGDFNLAFKSALVTGVEVEKTAETLGLAWGHFLTRNESGGKVYACERYPQIEIELRAEGIANSGEVPALFIKGPCMSSDNGKKILALPIPVKDLGLKLHQGAPLTVPLGSSGGSFSIRAENLYDAFPRYWNVVNVKLSNQTENLSVDGYEIISLLDQPLTLDFAVTQ